MKSLTKPALRVVPPDAVQISLPVEGVLKDVKHAFYGLCVQAGFCWRRPKFDPLVRLVPTEL
jgi:hypothetical protein